MQKLHQNRCPKTQNRNEKTTRYNLERSKNKPNNTKEKDKSLPVSSHVPLPESLPATSRTTVPAGTAPTTTPDTSPLQVAMENNEKLPKVTDSRALTHV